MGIKIEKIFVIVFFVCIFISSATLLAYDHVGEELKKLIITINIIFLRECKIFCVNRKKEVPTVE